MEIDHGIMSNTVVVQGVHGEAQKFVYNGLIVSLLGNE
jgi:hypothetical protein